MFQEKNLAKRRLLQATYAQRNLRFRLAHFSYWYNDFGEAEETKESGYSSFDNERQYTGAVYDDSTGLLYLNARFYDPQTGRFISRDTYRGEPNNAGTWHLYAYCANNPVNYVDPSGHFAIAIPWIGKAGIFLGGIFLTYMTTTKEFQRAWGRVTSGIEKKIRGASRYVKSKAKALSRDIGVSFSKAKKRYKKKTEVHHIVAQRDPRAETARWVLKKVGMKVSDEENLIAIKKGLHKRLHRNNYYSMVNSTLQSAYYKKKGSRVSRVKDALKGLRNYIEALNKAAPF